MYEADLVIGRTKALLDAIAGEATPAARPQVAGQIRVIDEGGTETAREREEPD
jgi:hypothetical protein